jgi:hypothetical protein
MPFADVFTPDAFSLNTLTAAINHLPYKPGMLGADGLFDERGIESLTAYVEEKDGVLAIVPVSPRGSAGKATGEGDRRLLDFPVPHLQEAGTLMADEVQGVRAFGSEDMTEVLETRRDEKLGVARMNLDYTIEVHRVKVLVGTWVDRNGDDQSLFTKFGVTQQTKALGLHATNRSQIATKMHQVRIQVRTGLGGVPWTGLRVYCGDAFWQALIDDKDVRDTYLASQYASSLRGDPSQRFTAFGAEWVWYEGDSSATLGDDAYCIPTGVPSLFLTRFAPADYVETVNTIGLPYYAKAEPIKMDKGYELEAQSNPLNICTRPRAVIKLTIS